MKKLAGIYRVKYLFVYPESGDIVLAGPAGPWETDSEGRVVNVDTNTPVLQLDDFVTALRNAYQQHGRMGCAIKPRQENLAAAKSFLDSWNGKALKPHQRDRWVADLRKALGKQDVDVQRYIRENRVLRVLRALSWPFKSR